MQSFLISIFFLLSSSVMASPQWGGSSGGGWNFQGSDSSPGNAEPSSGSQTGGGIDTSSASFVQTHNILIAHAVLGSAAWAFFFPIGAIFLRLNINHPIMLRLHIFFQIFAYILYVAAAAMGIWLAFQVQQHFDVWSEPHIIIGLVLLAFATIQPITGWIHHRIYHSRAVAIATTNRGPRPGRTIWGRVHLWFGRMLITLGIINGGLGLRLMEDTPAQDRDLTRDAEIGYSVAAGFMWCVYVFITVLWEGMRSARKRKQQYDSSRAGRRARARSPSSSDSSVKPELQQVRR